MAAASAKRNARIEISASAKGVKPGVDDARRQLRMMARDQDRATKQATTDAERLRKQRVKTEAAERRAASSSAPSGFLLGVGASIGGKVTGFLEDSASEALTFEKGLTRLQISGEMSASELAAFRAEVLKTSTATGRSATDLLNGASALVAFTGNAKEAQSTLRLLGETSQATGAQTAEIAGIFATFSRNHLPVEQWRPAMDMLVKQAHLGGVEMNDLAGSFTKVAAMSAVLFEGGKTVKGLGNVSAEAQILNNMTHDADKTSTYLNDMFQDLKKVANVKKLRAYHIEPFTIDPATGEKHLKDSLFLLDEIKKKIGTDPEKLSKLFPDIRGGGSLEYLISELDAVHSIADASADSNQVARDFAIYQASSAGQIEAAWNKVKVAVFGAMTPDRIAAFTHAVEQSTSILGHMIDVASQLESVMAKLPGGKQVWGGNFFDNAEGVGKMLARSIYGVNDDDRKAEAVADERDRRGEQLAKTRPDWSHDRIEQQLGSEDDALAGLADRSLTGRGKYSLAELVAMPGSIAGASNAPIQTEVWMRSMTDAITQAIREGLAQAPQKPVHVNIDGHHAGKAVANARVPTRPGGR